MQNRQKSSMGMANLALFLSLLLTAGLLAGVALASGGDAVRKIQDEERMLLEGKDIFAYSSGELVALWKASEIPQGASIGFIGYEGEAPQEEVPGLHFPFSGFDITTRAQEPGAKDNREALIALPLEETHYAVSHVRIADTGVPGPFGIEVGMTVDTLRSLLPEASSQELNVDTEDFDTLYTARYGDEDGSAAYSIQVYSVQDMVSLCVVTREGN